MHIILLVTLVYDIEKYRKATTDKSYIRAKKLNQFLHSIFIDEKSSINVFTVCVSELKNIDRFIF